jgi:hypothetical protein
MNVLAVHATLPDSEDAAVTLQWPTDLAGAAETGTGDRVMVPSEHLALVPVLRTPSPPLTSGTQVVRS